jgi:hypothetical protein
MGSSCASRSRALSSRLVVDSEDERLRSRFSSNSILLAGLSGSESYCRIDPSRIEGKIGALDEGEWGDREASIVASFICSDMVSVVFCRCPNMCVKRQRFFGAYKFARS